MRTPRTWSTLTPLDGSVGGWLAARCGWFGSTLQGLPVGFPAYAVVHWAPHDDWDDPDGELDLDALYDVLREHLVRHTASSAWVVGQWDGFDSTVVEAWPPAIRDAERLRLPHRSHVLFAGTAADLAPLPGSAGDTGCGSVPSTGWPEDRAWVVAADIDDWVTTVAGSTDLVDDLVADARLRAEVIAGESRRPEAWTPVGER